jgi:hypothetical protein
VPFGSLPTGMYPWQHRNGDDDAALPGFLEQSSRGVMLPRPSPDPSVPSEAQVSALVPVILLAEGRQEMRLARICLHRLSHHAAPAMGLGMSLSRCSCFWALPGGGI